LEGTRRRKKMKRWKKAIGVATVAVVASFALSTGAPSQAVSAEKGEIAVMLPAAGDPYFKLKSFGYIDEGKKQGYGVVRCRRSRT
jgi:ABC-type sugar transport system substrate-binding protein